MDKTLTYWVAFNHVKSIRTKLKNDIIVKLFEQGKTIIDFFESDFKYWDSIYSLDDNQISRFQEAKNELSNYAFLVEDLLEQGYKIIPITSDDYSKTMKKNLGLTYSPSIIYSKGNIQLLKEKSIAIVGSRKASEKSLTFTDNVAKNASKDFKVVVSGFAKGVDKQALDSAIKYKGQSIIVLPQGIGTFHSGFKKYYKQLIEGDVLVISTFHPKSPWSVQLAMARNPIIYGLANEIYVAESSDSGGTWSGVMDGLRKGRTIYVRKPIPNEKNANEILISKGAKAVDDFGNINEDSKLKIDTFSNSDSDIKSEKVEDKIIQLLLKSELDSKSIVEKLKIDWNSRKVTEYLKKHNQVDVIKGNPLRFVHKDKKTNKQKSMF